MTQYNYMTQTGYDKLNSELEELKSNGRQEVARAIAEAREKGDLSENAEYDSAKNAQGMLEAKINVIEMQLANVRIIDETQLDNSKVGVLTTVTIINKKSQKELRYKLVPENEADIKLNLVSVSSPVGLGLIGKTVGEIAVVNTPNGSIEFIVKEITLD
jgi:transcription elongation factor GreA